MALTINPSSAARQLHAWPLRSFGMGGFFLSNDNELHLELRLDRPNSEFGLVTKSSETNHAIATMAKFADNEPIHFHASWAVAACYSPSAAATTISAKVIVRLPSCQVDLIFKSYGHAYNFLTTLKGLATTAFMPQPISAEGTSKFQRMTFDMVKSGLVPSGNLQWAAVSDSTSMAHNQLWKTKDWADFVVLAGTKEFLVHKAVICPRSSFFKVACSPGFLEEVSGRVILEEDETTIETLLMELYGIENGKTGPVFTRFALKCEIEKEFLVMTLLKLFLAADKYDIPYIKLRAVDALEARLSFVKDPLTIASLAISIFNRAPENDSGLRDMIISHVAARLQSIIADNDAKAELTNNMTVMEILLSRLGELEHAVQNGSATKVHNPMLTPPSTPEKVRKSTRLAQRTPTS